ncbi:TNF receptor-associated factor 3-like protein [Lates japonicus]|uniref:TNF receptor-associated factor 3-like protein n=1 Tax=Lates japonicus TaxID=270547 RepID=A0AAD3MR81_LATJO|nr:TNF receptor-associated factor 3-like protein [Lates japonicus]
MSSHSEKLLEVELELRSLRLLRDEVENLRGTLENVRTRLNALEQGGRSGTGSTTHTLETEPLYFAIANGLEPPALRHPTTPKVNIHMELKLRGAGGRLLRGAGGCRSGFLSEDMRSRCSAGRTPQAFPLPSGGAALVRPPGLRLPAQPGLGERSQAPRATCCRRNVAATERAVRYGRVSILGAMVETLKDCDAQARRRELLDGCGGCMHHRRQEGTANYAGAVELSARADCSAAAAGSRRAADRLDAAHGRARLTDSVAATPRAALPRPAAVSAGLPPATPGGQRYAYCWEMKCSTGCAVRPRPLCCRLSGVWPGRTDQIQPCPFLQLHENSGAPVTMKTASTSDAVIGQFVVSVNTL